MFKAFDVKEGCGIKDILPKYGIVPIVITGRKSESPFFSILILAYNVGGYIEECLTSVRAQTFDSWEAIVVDDGSIDGTGDVCDCFGEEDARIRVMHQPNMGVAVSRNVLLKAARGEYVIFLDEDDFWYSEDMLFEVHEAIEKHGADMVAWWLKTYDTDTGRTVGNTNYIEETDDVQSGEMFLFRMLTYGRSCWWGWLYTFQRRLWEGSEVAFRPGRKVYEDMEVLFKVFLCAERVWVLGKYYYAYRVGRKDSATGSATLFGVIDKLEVMENNIWYLQKEVSMGEDIKKALVQNFSSGLISLRTGIYSLGGTTGRYQPA